MTTVRTEQPTLDARQGRHRERSWWRRRQHGDQGRERAGDRLRRLRGQVQREALRTVYLRRYLGGYWNEIQAEVQLLQELK